MVYLFVVIQIYNKFSGFLLFFTIIYNLSLEMSDEPKKIHNPVSLRVVYVIYREKEIVCAASANMDMLISLCALAYPLLCIFYFFSSSGMTGIAPFCVQTYALTLTPMR